jgi:5'-3' exonuclease
MKILKTRMMTEDISEDEAGKAGEDADEEMVSFYINCTTPGTTTPRALPFQLV